MAHGSLNRLELARLDLTRLALRGLLLVAAAAVAVPASAQSVEEIAKKLSEPPAAAPASQPEAACEAKLPDGSCADQPETRQMVLRRPSAAIAAAAQAFRADIKMSFLLGSAELTAQARATLDRFAAALVSRATYRPFVVEGHTDSSGSRDSNRVLSQARAASVVNYLASRGVDRSRLTAQGFGSDQPLPGRSPEDAANRRVEIVAR
ncbi:MAG: OmpA family protein [Sphingomonadales bacterium]|jgi:OOP family OmpA-OmpF porin